jgi:hypothetical protein
MGSGATGYDNDEDGDGQQRRRREWQWQQRRRAKTDQDVVQLFLVIRGYCCRFDDHQQSTYALEQAKHRVSTYYQAQNVTNTEYVEHFKALVGVVET